LGVDSAIFFAIVIPPDFASHHPVSSD